MIIEYLFSMVLLTLQEYVLGFSDFDEGPMRSFVGLLAGSSGPELSHSESLLDLMAASILGRDLKTRDPFIFLQSSGRRIRNPNSCQ